MMKIQIDKSPVNILLTPTQRDVLEQWEAQLKPLLPESQCASKAALIRIMVSELDGQIEDGSFKAFLDHYGVSTVVDRAKIPEEKLEEKTIAVKLVVGQKKKLKVWAQLTNFYVSDILRILVYEEAGLVRKGFMKTCINS